MSDDADHLDEIVKRSARDGIWITRDAEILHISEMEDRHVFYAYLLLKDWKKKEARPFVRRDLASWINRFKREMKKRRIEVDGMTIPSRKFEEAD